MLKFRTPSNTSRLALRWLGRHGRSTSLVSTLSLLLGSFTYFTFGEGFSLTDIISKDSVVIGRCDDSVIAFFDFDDIETPNLTITVRSHNDIWFA